MTFPRLLLAAAITVLSAASSHAQNFGPPPPFVPPPETLKEIGDKTRNLGVALATLQKQGVQDPLLADVEIYYRAASSVVEHQEFFHKDSAKWALAVLDRGLMRAGFLSRGEAPWTKSVGMTVARGYRSRVDGSVQPFAVTYPADYGKQPTKRWRVDIVLHGRDATITEVKFLNTHNGDRPAPADHDFVRVDVFGRGNNAYRWAGETDVFEAVEAFFNAERLAGRERFPDPARVVLRGFSMGGAGAWHLGLHWPDRWCVIGPGAGFTTTHGYTKLPDPLPPYQEACLRIYDAVDYAQNAFNVPVVAYSGELDKQKAAADNIEAALKKLGIPIVHLVAPGLDHKFPPEWFAKANEYYSRYADKGKPEYPDVVNFVTYTMKYPGCHWVAILGLGKHYERAHVLAARNDTGFIVKTENVRALHLTMPLGVNQLQEVEIDEQKLSARPVINPAGTYHIYLRRRGKLWETVLPQRLVTDRQQRPQKVHGLQGPIDDAFSESFLCVRGTGKPWHDAVGKAAAARLERFEAEWSKVWRGELPIKDDVDVTSDDIASRNLILFGDPASNSLIAQCLDGLPLTWARHELRFNGKTYRSDGHLPVLIYPSPLNAQRYIVLNSGHTIPTDDYKKTNALYFPRLGDYAVLRLDAKVQDPHAYPVADAGLFDEFWGLNEERNHR